MAERILLPLALAITCAAQAQIPNSGFENWSAPNGYDQPDNWITWNDLTAPYSVFTCIPGTPGHGGASHIQLTTKNVPGFTVVPGIATTGDGTSGIEGFPCSDRPAALTGWWQYNSTGPDEGLVLVYLTKWNTGLQQQEEIGAGYLTTGGNVGPWTSFSVPIDYISPDAPDTATINFSSSATGLLIPNSVLSVDDLAFDLSTEVRDPQDTRASFMIYPTPVTERLFWRTSAPIAEVQILDMDGRVSCTAQSPTAASLDVSGMPGGCHALLVRFMDGTVQRHRFVKY